MRATPAPVQVEANGNYYPPKELFTSGHWSASEKIVNLLPLDFVLDSVGVAAEK